MPKEGVLQQLKKYSEQNLPLVIFAEPNSQQLHLYVQEEESLHKLKEFTEDGFIMAPFDDSKEVLFFPFSDAYYFTEKITVDTIEVGTVEVSRIQQKQEEHEALVQLGIDYITQTKAEKIVLAREEVVALEKWNPIIIIQRLLALYPSAFRFMWYHPKEGWWCGATPETLVQSEKDSFFTMALAGTQPYFGKEPVWRVKEREEQQFVTDTILSQIKPLCERIQVSETYTQPAGMVAHLRTDIHGKMLPTTNLNTLARAIHPTPAICGTPTEVAKEFILEQEFFHRGFYTGFLGIVEKEKKSRLYVNLRSMKIKDKQASLFIGGGITKDSKPREEWIETCNKTQTMLRVLKPLLE